MKKPHKDEHEGEFWRERWRCGCPLHKLLSVYERKLRQAVSFRWSLVSEPLNTRNHCCLIFNQYEVELGRGPDPRSLLQGTLILQRKYVQVFLKSKFNVVKLLESNESEILRGGSRGQYSILLTNVNYFRN